MAGSGGVALAVAVGRAGGLGSLPAAMLSSEQLADQIDEFRSVTDAALNVGVCHDAPDVSPSELDAWTTKVSQFDVELGVDRSNAPAGPLRGARSMTKPAGSSSATPGSRQLPLRPAGAGPVGSRRRTGAIVSRRRQSAPRRSGSSNTAAM